MSQYIVSQMQCAKNIRMSYCIQSHFAVCKASQHSFLALLTCNFWAVQDTSNRLSRWENTDSQQLIERWKTQWEMTAHSSVITTYFLRLVWIINTLKFAQYRFMSKSGKVQGALLWLSIMYAHCMQQYFVRAAVVCAERKKKSMGFGTQGLFYVMVIWQCMKKISVRSKHCTVKLNLLGAKRFLFFFLTCKSFLAVLTPHSVRPWHWPQINLLSQAELELKLRLKSYFCVSVLPVVRPRLSEHYVWIDEVKEASPHPGPMWLQLAGVGEKWRGRRQERNPTFRFQIGFQAKDLQGSGPLLPLSLFLKCPPCPLTPGQMWNNIANIYIYIWWNHYVMRGLFNKKYVHWGLMRKLLSHSIVFILRGRTKKKKRWSNRLWISVRQTGLP